MPITTRSDLAKAYWDDADHFEHVLNHLLIPAVKKAGLKPIPPSTEGSDIIHANIISNLNQADLVLCDMSALNPNVFFELGIRTALNKPACVVKDDVTAHIPFDTGIINHQTYRASMAAWELEDDISRLARHIEKTSSASTEGNALWQYFGVSARAHLESETGTDADKLDYVMQKLEALDRKVGQPQTRQAIGQYFPDREMAAVLKDALDNKDVDYKIGQRVFHLKFGVGTVAEVDGPKVTVDFVTAGRKRVVAAFLSMAEI